MLRNLSIPHSAYLLPKTLMTVSKDVSTKLMQRLYDSVGTQVSRRADRVISHLQQNPIPVPQTSVLDDLVSNVWNQKPLSEAITDLTKLGNSKDICRSNILTFQTKNSFMANTDFFNVYPIMRDRKYKLPESVQQGIKFTAIKKRHPKTLQFMNEYFLVFPSYVEACGYYLETTNKTVNGLPLALKFAPIIRNLPYLASPIYHSEYSQGEIDPKTPFSQIPGKNQIYNSIQTQEIDENYENILNLIDFNTRSCSVLVRNLPFGLSTKTLFRSLWDYNFPVNIPSSNCIKTVISDAIHQVNVILIRFGHPEDAKRFVRTFHGKRWYSHQNTDLRRVYEPLKCEVLT